MMYWELHEFYIYFITPVVRITGTKRVGVRKRKEPVSDVRPIAFFHL
jgi:hypothetical protein